MIRVLLAATALLLPLPALAADVFLTVDNQSSLSAAINTYPIDDDGDPVEDNIGYFGDIRPGTRGDYKLDTNKCELVLVTVIMSDASEMRSSLDLCKSHLVVIAD